MYDLIESTESASSFHARPIPIEPSPEIWWNRPSKAALVLGSTQRDPGTVDVEACNRAGVEIVRRRSGGGAVLLIPEDVTWIDVIIPAGSPGWAIDIHAPMVWLGRHLAAVLAHVVDDDRAEIDVHDGPLVSTAWSPLICFDGLGPGEVLLNGKKLIGMSQRRTRSAARLQCCWYSRYDPSQLAALLSVPDGLEPSGLRPMAMLDVAKSRALPSMLCSRLSAVIA